VSSDEFEDIARLSGMPLIDRPALCHVLNTRYVGIMVAKKLGKDYSKLNLIIAHLGSGISVSIHSNGRIIDTCSDDGSPFTPERSGVVPSRLLVEECYSESTPCFRCVK
jgi:butyrate kinase